MFWLKMLTYPNPRFGLQFPGDVSLQPVNNFLRFLAMWAYVAASWPCAVCVVTFLLEVYYYYFFFFLLRSQLLPSAGFWGLWSMTWLSISLGFLTSGGALPHLFTLDTIHLYCSVDISQTNGARSQLVLLSLWPRPKVLLGSAFGLVMYWICVRAAWGLTSNRRPIFPLIARGLESEWIDFLQHWVWFYAIRWDASLGPAVARNQSLLAHRH